MSVDFAIDFDTYEPNDAKAEFQMLWASHVPESIPYGAFKDFGRHLLGDQLRGFNL